MPNLDSNHNIITEQDTTGTLLQTPRRRDGPVGAGCDDASDLHGEAACESGSHQDEQSISSPSTPAHTFVIALDADGRIVAGQQQHSDEAAAHESYPTYQNYAAQTYPPIAINPRVLSSVHTVSDDRTSINPSHEITEFLRSPDSAPLPSNTASAIPTPATRSRANTDRSGEVGEVEFPEEALVQSNMANMDGALPEDDGMQSLRNKLQEIKLLALSTEEKAQKMHALMTRDYNSRHAALPSPVSSATSGDKDFDLTASPMLGAAAMPIDPNNPYNLRPGDRDPVFSPLPKAPKDVEGDLDEAMVDDDVPDLGCMHYKRNVKVQCFDCQRWFPCRHCHDKSRDLPFAHSLNRKMTQSMLCMLCQTPQPAAEICTNCGEYAAWYYCAKCKLWDNDSNKRIYHCDDCGICRVGEGLGKDYVHCKRCNVCISISTSAAHPCIEKATEGNCPLCLVSLFESRISVVSLPCGHYMHGDCYRDLMAVTYKCPVCNKSAVNMELQWRKLDDEIEAQPMPEDEDLGGLLPHVEGTPEPDAVRETTETIEQRRPREVYIGCNDCGARSWTPFHWLGLKCQRCDSYNTNQMAPTAHHESDAERLFRQQQQEHRRHDFTGNAVLQNAGLETGDVATEQLATSALEVPNINQLTPESPSHQPLLSSSPRLPSGAQSPGRYFVRDIDLEPRRPSFTRFSTPSMPNLPTLSNLPDMPRMPRMPNLPNWDLPPALETMRQNMRQNLPNMPNMQIPNVELPRFSPYEMIDSLSRGLSPMRHYLRGLDTEGDQEGINVRVANRPTSVKSDPETRRGSKLRTSSAGDEGGAGVDLMFDSDDEIDHGGFGIVETVEDESAGEESGDELSDADMLEDEEDEVDGGEEDDFGIFGHR